MNKRSNALMNQILTQTLGNIGDKKVIPILMEIALNNDLPISVRSSAVEILSKKQAPELVDLLVEMLGDPTSRDKVNEFALNVMGDLSEERMIMALLEAYQLGRNKYYSLLNTVLSTFEEYQNPEVIPLLQEVALTSDLPHGIRLKAIKTLAKYDDERSIDAIVEMLEDPENYIFYYDIVAMMDEFGGYEKFKNRIRKVSHKAMVNQRKAQN